MAWTDITPASSISGTGLQLSKRSRPHAESRALIAPLFSLRCAAEGGRPDGPPI